MKILNVSRFTSFVLFAMQLISCQSTSLHRNVTSSDLGYGMECPSNMIPFPINGKFICKCIGNTYVQFPNSNNCHMVFTRGPCPDQHYVRMGLDDIEPSCVKNPCKEDGQVLFNNNCHKLYDLEPCPHGYYLGIKEVGRQLDCILNGAIPAYFIEPAARIPTCPEGSRWHRDACRLILKDPSSTPN